MKKNSNKKSTFTLAKDVKHVENCHNNRRVAFTLAEVLITLTIIGVVATLTIPTLIQNYKKRTVEVKLLQSYSLINQALQISYVENGPVSSWDKNITTAHKWTYEELTDWFNKYLAPYLKYNHTNKITEKSINGVGEEVVVERLEIILNNGVIMRLETLDPYDMTIAFKDNKIITGKNQFAYQFRTVGDNIVLRTYWNNELEDNCDKTLDSLKYRDRYGCYEASHGQGMLCSKLIEVNNWKIPNDYPYFK